MIASDYFVFGMLLMSCLFFFIVSLRHFLSRLKSGSLKFGRSREAVPLIFDEFGVEIPPCSNLTLHKFKLGWCVWCGKSNKELLQELSDDEDLNLFINLKDSPRPDFNSPTTATIKPLIHDEAHIDLPGDDVAKPFDSVFSSVISSAFCLKCKAKVSVLDPVFYDLESAHGVRRYLKGSCAICRSKINAIVKRGD